MTTQTQVQVLVLSNDDDHREVVHYETDTTDAIDIAEEALFFVHFSQLDEDDQEEHHDDLVEHLEKVKKTLTKVGSTYVYNDDYGKFIIIF